MATIHPRETTTATPEQFVAGLTDFGPGRQELFGNSADDYLKVHDQGPNEADVTEGSGGVWERLHYNWSDPTHIELTTTDSNLWGGHSGHTYTLTRQPNGTTEVDAVVVREQEPQEALPRASAWDLRQAGPGKGVRKDRQRHRGPERRCENVGTGAVSTAVFNTRMSSGGGEIRTLGGP